MSRPASLWAHRSFILLWFARLASVSASQMLMVGLGWQMCGSNQLGEFESGTTAAWLGPVGSVVLGGVGVLLVAGLWPRLFPALARRDALLPDGTGQRHPAG